MMKYIIDGLQTSILVGWLYGIGAIGLGLIYKYLKFPDFTTIASLIVGSICCVAFGQNNIALGILASIVVGILFGTFTALQINIVQIPPIIAGIITWTISRTLAYKFSRDEATISFDRDARQHLDWIISSDFSWVSISLLFILTLLICLIVSQYFKRKQGVLTLAMLGDTHFLKYRHTRKGTTKWLLLIISNGIIGLAGGLAAIQANSATIQNHGEFLVTALSAYALANFFINWINKRSIGKFIDKENKPSSGIIFKLIIFLLPWLALADEKEAKIFATLLLYVVCAVFVYAIFSTANIYFGVGQQLKHFNYIIQGIILLVILSIPLLVEKFTKNPY